MRETIQPALTPEEWARVASWPAWDLGADAGGALHAGSPQCHFHAEEDDPATVGLDSPEGPRLHALAALALHGQPFGFAHEDVAALQWAVAKLERALREQGHDFPASVLEWRQIQHLAVRIAALLPPATP